MAKVICVSLWRAETSGAEGKWCMRISAVPSAIASTACRKLLVSAAIVGAALLVSCGGSGGSSSISTVTPPAPDFSISVAPSSFSTQAGTTSAPVAVSVGGLNGFSGSVSVNIGGLPTGVTTSVALPLSINANASAQLTFSVPANTTTGNTTLSFQATSGTLSHSASFTLMVTPPADFSISASPTSVSTQVGTTSAAVTVSVSGLNGFTGSVSVAVNGLPSGVACSPSCPLSINANASAQVSFVVSAGAATGNTTLTVQGTSGNLSHSTPLTLTTTPPPPDFSISVVPSSVSAQAGTTSSTVTVSITALNGFSSSVSAAVSGLPAGVTCSPSCPLSINAGASTPVAFVVPANASPGTFDLTVQGTSGNLSHNMPLTLTITSPPPTLTLSATATTVFIGQPFVLTWTSAYTTSCTASQSWSGTQAVSGNQTVTPASAGTFTYALSCSGPGGSANSSVTLTVDTPSLSLANTFTPNSLTLSTSEGAPYGDCDFWLATPANCNNESNLGYGPTKVMRIYICLSGEVTLDDCSQEPEVTTALSAQMLSDINSRIAAFAGTGMRLMIRFTYNFGPIGPTAQDAPESVILEHIDQLAPILLQYQDLIFTLEAGFIGTWGEWHDSTNGNDTAAVQAAVLDKELSYFNGVFPILVRYPGDLIQYTGSTTPQAGLGMHDDYYASDSDDGGTWNTCNTDAGYCLSSYTASQFESYGAQVATTTMFAGEFGADYATLQTCSALDGYSYTYHPQSISLFPYPTDIGTTLQTEGCALSFYNKVGTRLELQQATIIGNPTPDGQLYVSLTMANTGYGRVIRQRPATLVLLSNGSPVAQIPIPLASMDLRQLASASSPAPVDFQFTVTLPSTFPSSGSITAALLVPDPAPSLTSQAAYALPLNSLDQNSNQLFNPTTGYNTFATFNAN